MGRDYIGSKPLKEEPEGAILRQSSIDEQTNVVDFD